MALLLDPDVSRWLRPSPEAPFTRSEADSWLTGDRRHWEERGFGPCLLCDRADDSFVGRGGLRWTEVAGERCVELTYALVSERWGQGLATEAARAAVSWAQRLDLITTLRLNLSILSLHPLPSSNNEHVGGRWRTTNRLGRPRTDALPHTPYSLTGRRALGVGECAADNPSASARPSPA